MLTFFATLVSIFALQVFTIAKIIYIFSILESISRLLEFKFLGFTFGSNLIKNEDMLCKVIIASQLIKMRRNRDALCNI